MATKNHKQLLQRTYPLRSAVAAVATFLALDIQDIIALSGVSDNGQVPTEVTVKEFFNVWLAAEQLYKKGDIGFTVGNMMASAPPSNVFYCLFSSPNYLIGMRRLSKFKTLFTPVKSKIFETDKECKIAFESEDPSIYIPVSLAVAHLVFSSSIIQNLTCKSIQPLSVSVNYAANITHEVNLLLGNRIDKSNSHICSITYKKDDVLHPFLTSNAKLWVSIEEQLNAEFHARRSRKSVSTIVRQSLLENLPSRSFSMKKLLGDIGMSRSTLQRKLRLENTSFKRLLDEIRRDLAVKYLGNIDISLIEISYMVGYSEPNSFFRSFKRLTGITPSEYREKLISENIVDSY